jgi:hypothetical protein
MPQNTTENRIPLSPSRFTQDSPDLGGFRGFARLQSNTTYTPNQFFDVCLPHYSRGSVRLVAYMIRKTLGWCDSDGNPQEEQILTSHQDLIKNAGISRGAIRSAIDEAIKGKFIECVREGRSKTTGKSAISPLFQLKWDDGEAYIKDPEKFCGFFEGQGHRTDIPNQFYDRVVTTEPLATIKVVGSIIRFSIGFQARHGRRRLLAELSYKQIQNYAKISNPTHMSRAIRTALENNYILCVEKGYFDPNAGKESTSSKYSLRWQDSEQMDTIGSKRIAEDRFKKDSGGSVIGSKRIAEDRFKKDSVIGSKRIAEDRFKKDSGIKIKQRNKTLKQQQTDGEPNAVAENSATHHILLETGFDDTTARLLSTKHAPEIIDQQIKWLPFRNVQNNKLGLLRKAIEENYDDPLKLENNLNESSEAVIFAKNFYKGFAKYVGEGSVEPSANDYRQAGEYVTKLLAVVPNKSEVEKWGNSFGIRCGKFRLNSTSMFPSLVNFLRLQGSQFLEELQSSKERYRRQIAVDERQKHESAYRSSWIKYLRKKEEEFQKCRERSFQAFQAWKAKERQEIAEKRRDSQFPTLVDQWLKKFDDEGSQLGKFQEYFQDDVLGFWGWDRELNPERLLV